MEKESGAVDLILEVQRGDYYTVTTDEFKQWIDADRQILILDTMPPYDAGYRKGHTPGAAQFLCPIPEMTAWDAKETDGRAQEDFIKVPGGDKDKPMVICCGFVKCTRSHNGAAWAGKQRAYPKKLIEPAGTESGLTKTICPPAICT